jgi:two-component system NarL family sensor kinase
MNLRILGISVLLQLVFYSGGWCSIFSINRSTISQGGDTVKINKLNSLCAKNINNDLRKAREYASEAYDLSIASEYDNGIATSASNLGTVFYKQGDYSKALDYYVKALKIYETIDYKIEIANTKNNIALTWQKLGESDKALNYHLDALNLYISLNNNKGIAASYNNIGIIHYMNNNFQKALYYFKYSLGIKEKIHDSIGTKQTLGNIGAIHFEMWQYDSALFYFKKCLEFETRLNDQSGIANTLSNIGRVYQAQGKLDYAKESYNRSLYYSRKVNDRENMVSVMDNLGVINSYSGNYTDAISYFDSSLMIAQIMGLKEEIKSIYQHLSETHAKQKQYKKAYEYYLNYDEINTQLLDEKNKVSETEALFVKQQKENEILILDKEKQKKKTQVIILSGIILIIIIFSAFIYFQYRLRQKAVLEKTLSEQQKLRFKAVVEAQDNERKKIAANLHDNLGILLSVAKMKVSELGNNLNISKKNSNSELVNNSINLIDDACKAVRNISHDLMPGTLTRLGLVSAVKNLVHSIQTENKLKIGLKADGLEERLSATIEINLFSIIKELMNNIVNHSRASEVNILLKRNENIVTLNISDNGTGFDKKLIESSTGIGWKNIKSRVAFLDGKLNIKSQKGTGTEVNIKIKI